MGYDKKLVYTVASIVSFSALLVMAVWAYDKPALIDHLSHYHFDPEHMRQEAEKEAYKKEENKRVQVEWLRELRTCDPPDRSGDRGGYEGTCGPPDRDK